MAQENAAYQKLFARVKALELENESLRSQLSTTKKKVEKHKKELEKFIHPRTSFASKKKILTSAETGEVIFFIIKSSVVPFLTDYIKQA